MAASIDESSGLYARRPSVVKHCLDRSTPGG
jgi:hypothetical protein